MSWYWLRVISGRKMVPSLALMPVRRGTACCLPAAKASEGFSGSRYPSTFGLRLMGLKNSLSLVEAASSSSGVASRRAASSSSAWSQPSSLDISSPVFSASCRVGNSLMGSPRSSMGPLSTMARSKRPFGQGADHEVDDAHAARGFTEDGYVFRIASEDVYVLLHPLQRRYLVEEAVVAGDAFGRFL